MAEQPPAGAAVSRRTDPRMWCIFSIFFFSLVAGTVMLAFIWVHPDAPLWMDIAGLTICALPWLFWLFMFLYRLVFHGGSSNQKPMQPMRTATVAPAPIVDSSPAATKEQMNGGADECVGHMGTIDVRWAQAVLMDIDEDEDDRDHHHQAAENEGTVRRDVMPRQQREGSSHDSEKPLAFSLAS